MAQEETIGLRIQLNGINAVVTDVKTLETELKKAKEDLRDIGLIAGTDSQEFKKLKTEILEVEGKLTKLNKATETITSEKKSEGLAKFGAGIASSFAAATAAVSLFGNESDAVSKAATTAQNALTLAMSARGIMEIRTGASIVARTIADKAATAAANTQIGVLKALYATLAANPMTAIIAVIGALIAAYVAFGNETEDLSGQIEQLNSDLETLKMSQEDYLSFLEQSLALQLAMAEKDKASSQEILDIKLENIDLQIEAVTNAYTQQKKLMEDLYDLELQQAENEKKSDTEISKIKIKNRTDLEKLERDSNNKITQLDTQRRILLIKNEQETTQKLEKLEQERAARRRKALVDSYNKELELLKKVEEQIIATSSKIPEVTSNVVDKQKEILDKQAEYIKTRNEALLTDSEKLQKSLSELLLKTLPSPEELTKVEDSYRQLFDIIDEGIRTGKLDFKKSTGWEDFVNFAETKLPGIGSKLNNVNEEAKKSFIEYFNNLDTRIKAIFQEVTKGSKVLKDFLGVEPTLEQLETLRQVEEMITKTREEKVKLGKSDYEIEREALKIIEQRFNIQSKIEEKLIEITKLRYNNEQIIAELNNTTDEARKTQLNTQLQLNNDLITSLEGQGEEYKKITKAIYDGIMGTSEFVTSLKKIGLEIDKNNLKILENQKNIDAALDPTQYEGLAKVFENNAENYAQLVNFLITNQQVLLEKLGPVGINTILQGLSTGISKMDNLTKKQLQELITYLTLAQEELGKTFNISEQAFADLIDRLTKKLKSMPKELSDTAKEIIKNISETLQVVSSSLSKWASIEAQRMELESKKAAKRYEDNLKKIEGDGEKSNKKRLELEEQYQKEKAYIEKRALIKSLQFQLAQAIAETAQAVVAALPNYALAAIVGILGAYQVATIREQIIFAQSLAGGGKVKRSAASGMLVGPSHEYGGIMLGASGINVEGGEAIMNRTTSLNYGGMISTLNQMGGGQPIVNNPSGSLQEERLLQILAKDRQVPMRAYVLSSEITNSQAINKRLDELATL